MPDILVATDSPVVFDQINSILAGPQTVLRWVRSGKAVLPALQRQPASLVVSDMQIGTMGGVAIAMEIALEEGAGRLEPTPVLLLVDRRADVFLAKRTGVAGWLVKPLDPLRIRSAAAALLGGGRYEDPSYAPNPVAVRAGSASIVRTGK